MKTIGVLLLISLLFQTPPAFAESEYDRGYRWAKEQNLSDSSKCSRDLHPNTEELMKDFSAGCVDYMVDAALAS